MGTDRLVYIRTDGNSTIATGHLIRCLSIADACLSLGMKIRFLVSDQESLKLLQGFDPTHKFPVQVLKTAAYDNLEKELPEVLDLLANKIHKTSEFYDASVAKSDSIYFIDSYYATEKYLSAVKAMVPVAYLDDLRLFDYSVDLVINYDVIPDNVLPAYQKSYQNAQQALLGASYTPLRRQFAGRSATLRKQVSDILVTTGGSDPYHFCLKLIDAFQKLLPPASAVPHFLTLGNNLCVHVVIGRLNEDRDTLNILADSLSFIRLHENVSDMASLMESCDLAVSAAGTTLYELCAVGIPAVSYTMADNQITAAKAFADIGIIPCAGDIRDSYDLVLNSIMAFVTDMSENYVKRKSAHESMSRFIDGKGAMRIAEALFELRP